MKRHQELLTQAIERDAMAQQALLEGDEQRASAAFAEAAELYRRSWAQAPPGSYGRLVGMLKAAVLAGGGEAEAAYVSRTLAQRAEGSPTASYALALAALIGGDDQAAERASAGMAGGSEAFDRTAAASHGLAAGDRKRYALALQEIVHDFERRPQHLTGVAIADTALVLERLASRRGMTAEVRSKVLPIT